MSFEEGLFGKIKQCEYCKRPLPSNYEGSLCPRCAEAQLFRDVKEYIRANDVNEYEVSEHFQIPLKQVKGWIREGRIEYKTDPENEKHVKMHCQKCGVPIDFGVLCQKCLKQENAGKGYSFEDLAIETRMHYLDKDGK